jgi:hypothetical protein
MRETNLLKKLRGEKKIRAAQFSHFLLSHPDPIKI